MRSFVLGFGAVAVVCVVAACAAFEAQRRDIEAGAKRTMGNMAVLKAGQVDHWRRERLSDGMALSGHTALGDAFERWLARGAGGQAGRRWMLQRLEAVRRSHEDYASLLMLDRHGQVRFGTPEPQEIDVRERQLALRAMATRQALLGDFHLDATSHKPFLGMASPLLAGDDDNLRVVGALYFRVDPARFIYPMIEAWPLDSRTAETLLVRRDDDRVLFLNRLRRVDAKPLTFSAPLNESDLPAALALRGETGVGSGRDYRGERVLYYLLRIPDTEWAMVAKIDEAEVYAPLRDLAWYVSLGLFAALNLAAYLFWTLRGRAELAYHGYRTQLQNRMLMQRLENVARSASDIIVLTDMHGHVVEVNDKAVEAFGYSRAELHEMAAIDLRSPECRATFCEQWRNISANGSAAFETVFRRKDGSCFSADVSGHFVSAGSDAFIQAIVRDATERKRREAALQLHEQMTRHMQEGLSIVRDEDRALIYVNPRAEAMFGYEAGELLGKPVTCLTPEEDDPMRMAGRIHAALREFGAWGGEIRNARKDGTVLWCKTTVSGIDHPDHGKVWLSIHTDITALKTLENAQHDALMRIRKLGRHLVSVQETERRRLGAELHDRTSANLAAVKILLRDVAALMPDFMGSVLSQKMEDAQALIDDTDATIRDISGSLRPPLLDFLGLTATLQSLAGKFEKRTGMKIDVRNDHVPRLDGDAETLLYRIVQEALSNCAKHARARRVDVDLKMSGDHVVLTVADDGVGFDAAIAARGETLGLATMRERAEFADGTLVVESTLGRGTAICVAIPHAAGSAEPPPRLAVRSVRSGL